MCSIEVKGCMQCPRRKINKIPRDCRIFVILAVMVRANDLSAALIVSIEQDFAKHYDRTKTYLIKAGKQLPRSRYGWLHHYYQRNATKRSNGIHKAVSEFNSSRGVPVDRVVFTGSRQFTKCLAPVDVNDAGEVVWRNANEDVWTKDAG